MNPGSSWEWAKRLLAFVLQLAGTLAGWFTVSLPIPDQIVNYPRFVIVGALLLAWVILNVVSQRLGWKLVAGALVLGLLLGITFMAGSPEWIFESRGERFFRGKLTTTAADYLQKHPSVTEEEYFDGSGRDPALVWTEESRRQSRVTVVWLYSAAISLFSFGVFGAIELLFQRSKSSPPASGTTPPPASGNKIPPVSGGKSKESGLPNE
jgi:hypothetical protein